MNNARGGKPLSDSAGPCCSDTPTGYRQTSRARIITLSSIVFLDGNYNLVAIVRLRPRAVDPTVLLIRKAIINRYMHLVGVRPVTHYIELDTSLSKPESILLHPV